MCEAKRSAGTGPFMAAVVLFLVIAAVWAVSALAPVLAAVTVAILAVDAAAAVVTWRMVRYGRRMRPARRLAPVRRPAARVVRAPYQLPAPPLAIAAPDRYGTSPGDAPAVTVPAVVVPGARAGERVER